MFITALSDYLLFFAKLGTFLIFFLIIISMIASLKSTQKSKQTPKISIRSLSKRLKKHHHAMMMQVLDKKAYKKFIKSENKTNKINKTDKTQKNLYVMTFNGDMHASQVTQLSLAITTLIQICNKDDRVFLKLESPGGTVNGYGLAASELMRLKAHGIRLDVGVDKVAASGGYMMAAVADHIYAAPFAIIGSIGVVAQLPNFNRFLKDKGVDFEQHTAGKYKRTLTMFGENSEDGREKFQDDLNLIHKSFIKHLQNNRPQLNPDEVATGEYWLAEEAMRYGLVDTLCTTEAHLLKSYQDKQYQLFELSIETSKSNLQKLLNKTNLHHIWERIRHAIMA